MWLAARKYRGSAAAAAAILALFGVSSCSVQDQQASAPTPVHAVQQPPPAPAPPPLPSPESVRANELGEVPVLMYHRITPQPSSVYDRTPQEFRAELERLAAEGYVPVTAAEYVSGQIDIPAGTHPVVLTFDDGAASQFTLDGSGQPAPDTAVRILLDVAASHPGFRPVATFYVFNPPFEEPTGKVGLNWLRDHGFEIGNHTLNHPTLSKVSEVEAQQEIAGMQRVITDAVPGLQVRTLALPLGVHPDQENLAVDGSADGVTYHHEGVMLVGSNPAPSPWSADFDRTAIPRIRSQAATGEDAQYGSTAWLDKLAGQPDRRYTSDGDAQRISAPGQVSEQPAPAVAARVHRY